MHKSMISLVMGAALLAVPALAARDDPDAELAKMLAGKTAGPAVTCIDLGFVNNSTVLAGKGIVYRVGGRLYVNLPDDPSRIRRDDILVTKSSGTHLCERDPVNLVDWSTRLPHGFVLLGKFVPYSTPPKAR